MAVCSLFAKELEAGSKAVYLAPSKFLVMQKYQEWQDKFGESMRLRMAEVTGDNSMSHTEMAAADIILSTPEKWDSVSRKWNEMEAFVSAIKLLMVDEIHFIADEERGATLEAIVCRMKYISSWNQQQGRAEGCVVRPLRIVGVSASVPNLEDVGRWLGAPPSHICAFGHEFRPVPLFIHTLSGGKFTNEFMFDKGLNTKIPELIRQHSNGRPVLVFCSTRKSTQAAALQLARESAVNLISGAQRLLLHQRAREINNCQDKDLRECLSAGVGFHNGQLCLEDRKVVEKLFLEKALISIYATSTLAVGANLPAFLVIIKSTIQYRRVAGIATWAEYEVHSIQQMAGRAGRPGFDTEGKVISKRSLFSLVFSVMCLLMFIF
jgi:ATP-dependent DNA helicase HFM1/MER3